MKGQKFPPFRGYWRFAFACPGLEKQAALADTVFFDRSYRRACCWTRSNRRTGLLPARQVHRPTRRYRLPCAILACERERADDIDPHQKVNDGARKRCRSVRRQGGCHGLDRQEQSAGFRREHLESVTRVKGHGVLVDCMDYERPNTCLFRHTKGAQHGFAQQGKTEFQTLASAINGKAAEHHDRCRIGQVMPDAARQFRARHAACSQRVIGKDIVPIVAHNERARGLSLVR